MNSIIQELEANITTFKGLLEGVSAIQQTWKPSLYKWSLLEVLCHLYDEELMDFRFRVGWVLEKPNEVPPPFNPLNWVVENRYEDQNYKDKLTAFISARKESVQWLKNLKQPAWDNSFIHPKLGSLSAAYFLQNWLAHDYLHIRQINNLKYQYIKNHYPDLDYAGMW